MVFCSLVSLLPISVYASEAETTTSVYDVNDGDFILSWDEFKHYLSFSVGLVYDAGSSVLDDIDTIYKSVLTGVNGFQDNGDGTVTVTCDCISSEVLEEIRDLLKDYIEEQEPYKTYLPESFSDNRGINEVMLASGNNMKPSGIVAMLSFMNEYKGNVIFGNSAYNWYYLTVLDGSKYRYAYYDSTTGSINFVDADLINAYSCRHLEVTKTSGYTVQPQNEFTYDDLVQHFNDYGFSSSGCYKEDGSRNSSVNFIFRSMSRTLEDGTVEYYIDNYFGAPLVVFDSASDLASWITKNPLAFTTNSFNMPITNNITLDPSTISKYDDALMKKIYDQLVENGKNALTSEQMQKIIDDTIAAALGEIAGNTGETTEEVKYTNQILNAILHENRIFFSSVVEFDDKFYTDFLGFKSSILEDLGNIADYVLTGNKTLVEIEKNSDKMLDKLDALIGISTLDLLNDVFGDEEPAQGIDSLGDAFTFTELFKSKFPFSMPWDLYALFCLFEAEPVCPDFKIPLRLNIYNLEEVYEIPVNGADWEYISYLSRSLHTVLFCAYLYKFTLKFIVKK